MASTFSLTNTTRSKAAGIPFKKIKEEVLGKKYDLSCALIGPAEMKRITLETKHKDKVSNVLSFPLSKTSGEILICPTAAAPYSVGYLFIHGLFHLEGLRHGSTMENKERLVLQRFNLFKNAKNSHRNRRRLVSRKSSNRRAAR
jgi:ssRNA-specific RNase YbeY (16S rRNA maturation enzyme)